MDKKESNEVSVEKKRRHVRKKDYGREEKEKGKGR